MDNAGEYVWPRTLNELEQMVEARGVFVVEADCAVVGMAYTCADADKGRCEFGGAFVDDTHRENGLAGGLARVALVAHFSENDPSFDEPLIAHVHEFNLSNIRGVLQKLGVKRDGSETPPSDIVPPNISEPGASKRRFFSGLRDRLTPLCFSTHDSRAHMFV